jgi:hypothetical protein
VLHALQPKASFFADPEKLAPAAAAAPPLSRAACCFCHLNYRKRTDGILPVLNTVPTSSPDRIVFLFVSFLRDASSKTVPKSPGTAPGVVSCSGAGGAVGTLPGEPLGATPGFLLAPAGGPSWPQGHIFDRVEKRGPAGKQMARKFQRFADHRVQADDGSHLLPRRFCCK